MKIHYEMWSPNSELHVTHLCICPTIGEPKSTTIISSVVAIEMVCVNQ